MNEKEKKVKAQVWKIYSSMKTKQIGTHTGIFSITAEYSKKKEKNIELLWHFLMSTYLVVWQLSFLGSISRYSL